MTSARVFYGLIAAVVVTGVPASFDPAWERLYVICWVVATVLAALVAVAKVVVDEVRWHREIDAVINEPEDPGNPVPVLLPIPPAMLVAADELVAK